MEHINQSANHISRSIFIIIQGFVLLGNSQVCTNTGWNYDDTPCPELYNEIYKDFDPYIVKTNRVCCEAGTLEEIELHRNAPNCRVTQCLGTSQGDLCSTLDHRYINNTKLEYEEVMRDPCTFNGVKNSGVVALCCRVNSTESLMVTTLGAEENEFPHQAKLKLPGHCGGTIYNNRYIITAAHCLVDEQGQVEDISEAEVILGTNIADLESKEYIYKVKRAIPHPQYGGLSTSREYKFFQRHLNDIGLLELDRKIQFSENVKSLEIAAPGFNPFDYADNAVIVGWGTTDTLTLTTHLQKADVVLRSDTVCKTVWEAYYVGKYEGKLLCVGGVMEDQWSPTAGAGDSGGPAICRKENGHPCLCGVTSFGGDDELCSRYNDEVHCPPSVYAEVERFHRWIVENAGPQNESTFHRPYLYGRKVGKGEYVHQVRITSESGKACGGTLISENIVVTAAQCIFKVDAESQEKHEGLQVTTGMIDLNETGAGVRYGVLEAKHFPGFRRSGKRVNLTEQKPQIIITDKFHKHDLAVVKLDGNVSVDISKLPVLPGEGEVFGEGVELAFPRNLGRGGHLLARDFTILEEEECQRRIDRMSKMKMDGKVGRNVLCGIEKYSGGSTCDRELGGGLICGRGDHGRDVLCGIQVFRLCMFSIPNGFVNVARYRDWIENSVKEVDAEALKAVKVETVYQKMFSRIVSMFEKIISVTLS